MDEQNVHHFWGYSPALDLQDWLKPKESVNNEKLKILQVCPYDARHTITTMGRATRHLPASLADPESKDDSGSPASAASLNDPPVDLYVYEDSPEGLARHLLLVAIWLDANLPLEARTQLMLEVHGNAFVRPSTAAYLDAQGRALEKLIAGLVSVGGKLPAPDSLSSSAPPPASTPLASTFLQQNSKHEATTVVATTPIPSLTPLGLPAVVPVAAPADTLLGHPQKEVKSVSAVQEALSFSSLSSNAADRAVPVPVPVPVPVSVPVPGSSPALSSGASKPTSSSTHPPSSSSSTSSSAAAAVLASLNKYKKQPILALSSAATQQAKTPPKSDISAMLALLGIKPGPASSGKPAAATIPSLPLSLSSREGKLNSATGTGTSEAEGKQSVVGLDRVGEARTSQVKASAPSSLGAPTAQSPEEARWRRHPLAGLLDCSLLKFQDLDALMEVFKHYRLSSTEAAQLQTELQPKPLPPSGLESSQRPETSSRTGGETNQSEAGSGSGSTGADGKPTSSSASVAALPAPPKSSAALALEKRGKSSASSSSSASASSPSAGGADFSGASSSSGVDGGSRPGSKLGGASSQAHARVSAPAAVLHMEKCWDMRSRRWYGDRYDNRVNMIDWDYHMRLAPLGLPRRLADASSSSSTAGGSSSSGHGQSKDDALATAGSIVHFHHFRAWRLNGVAYELRDSSYHHTNTSLLSTAFGRTKEFKDRTGRDVGRSVAARGFWGDLTNSPYHAWGTVCEEDSFFKVLNKQFTHTAVDIAEFNVMSLIREARTGSPKPAEEEVEESREGESGTEDEKKEKDLHRAKAARGPTSMEELLDASSKADPDKTGADGEQEVSSSLQAAAAAAERTAALRAAEAALDAAVLARLSRKFRILPMTGEIRTGRSAPAGTGTGTASARSGRALQLPGPFHLVTLGQRHMHYLTAPASLVSNASETKPEVAADEGAPAAANGARSDSSGWLNAAAAAHPGSMLVVENGKYILQLRPDQAAAFADKIQQAADLAGFKPESVGPAGGLWDSFLAFRAPSVSCASL